MAKIVYDTGEMLLAAKNMERALEEFSGKKKAVKKLVGKTKAHTDDPKTRAYVEKYEEMDQDVVEKLEKNMKGYVSTMRSAAKKVADTVKSLNV